MARALYRQPGILFLDEATSHLDVEREKAVNNALRLKQMTRIVIAHRPETIRASGRVITLRDGVIVESANPVVHNLNGSHGIEDESWLFARPLTARPRPISLPNPAA
ncbi:MAG: hypothetical protein ABWZ64_05195 [Xanthobacteraceae bacterium]